VEETTSAYPDSRIVYLRLTGSITGWNPNEEIRNARKVAEENNTLDDLQKSIWIQLLLKDGPVYTGHALEQSCRFQSILL
jgi:hypothetical protein